MKHGVVMYIFVLILTLWLTPCTYSACEVDVLSADDPIFEPGRFGWSVAMDGDYMVVGAPTDNEAEFSAGAVYVFQKIKSKWVLQNKLTASDAFFHDNLGRSVAIDGDVIVAGAPHSDPMGQGKGKAYVYRRNIQDTPDDPSDDIWEEETILRATEPQTGENLGRSVSISGNFIVLGVVSSERAIVFQFQDGEWLEHTVLINSDSQPDDYFGTAVSIDEDIIVVGAQLHDGDIAGDEAGSAYVFSFDGTTWNEEIKLVASDKQRVAFFGNDVAVDNSNIIVGARRNAGFGSAYLFTKVENSWKEVEKLEAFDAELNDNYGSSVDIQENIVLIGATGDDHSDFGSGSAYLYKENGSHWDFQEKIIASDAEFIRVFGWSLAIDGENAIISNPARVYIYKLFDTCITLEDYSEFQNCFHLSDPLPSECDRFDVVFDGTIDISDYQALLPLLTGP